ncbi:MAG: GTPase Era [Candidatus Omnitrophota bacterium]
MTKAGVVAIIGRANAGKSTLLNRLAGEKVAIVSPVPQTTRHQIRAIYNDPRGQIVFCDTPGMHVGRHSLDRAMVTLINDSLSGADVIVYLVDSSKHVGEEEQMALERLSAQNKSVILGLNKIDMPVSNIPEYLSAWEQKLGRPLSEVTHRVMPVPICALDGTNLDRLLEEIFARLPEGEALYPQDVLTDFPRQWMIQDVIREKLLSVLLDELPFSLAVLVEEAKDRNPKLVYVKARILVERDSQKGIVIGHNGSVLKKAGEAARRELEDMFGKKFYLDLLVRVEEKWKENRELLKDMGYVL